MRRVPEDDSIWMQIKFDGTHSIKGMNDPIRKGEKEALHKRVTMWLTNVKEKWAPCLRCICTVVRRLNENRINIPREIRGSDSEFRSEPKSNLLVEIESEKLIASSELMNSQSPQLQLASKFVYLPSTEDDPRAAPPQSSPPSLSRALRARRQTSNFRISFSGRCGNKTAIKTAINSLSSHSTSRRSEHRHSHIPRVLADDRAQTAAQAQPGQ